MRWFDEQVSNDASSRHPFFGYHYGNYFIILSHEYSDWEDLTDLKYLPHQQYRLDRSVPSCSSFFCICTEPLDPDSLYSDVKNACSGDGSAPNWC